MDDETYYDILGIRPKASHREVVRAFSRLTEHYRSELATDPSARERLQQVKGAYETLTNYESRLHYNIERGLPDPPRPGRDSERSGLLGQIDSMMPENWPVLLPWLSLVIGGNLAYYLLVGELPWFWLRYVNGPEDYIIYPLGFLLFILLARLLARRS